MLQAVTSPTLQQGAHGQLATISCQFASDQALTGQLLRFNPALFLNTSGVPSSTTAWQIIYPTSGTHELTLVSADVWKNYKAKIEILDASNFKIHFEFFYVADLNNYINGANAPNNNNIFQTSYGSYQDVYQSQKINSLYVHVAGDSATCELPTSANKFCTGGLTFHPCGWNYRSISVKG